MPFLFIAYILFESAKAALMINDVSALLESGSAAITIPLDDNHTYSLFKLDSGFKNSVVVLGTTGALYKIEYGFDLVLGVFDDSTPFTISFSLEIQGEPRARFQVSLDKSKGYEVRLPDCPEDGVQIENSKKQTVTCKLLGSQSFELESLLSLYSLATTASIAPSIPLPGKFSSVPKGLAIFTFKLVILAPTRIVPDTLNRMQIYELLASIASSKAVYASTLNGNAKVGTCPTNCLECDTTGKCTACSDNFQIDEQFQCECKGHLITKVSQASFVKTNGFSNQELFLYSDTCRMPQEPESKEFVNLKACEASLRRLIEKGSLMIPADASESITVGHLDLEWKIDQSLLKKFEWDVCPSTIKSRTLQALGKAKDAQTPYDSLYIRLNDSTSFNFTQPIEIDFGNFSSCNRATFKKLDLDSFACDIAITISVTSLSYENIVATLRYRYLKLLTSKTQKQKLLPLFDVSPALSTSKDSNISTRFCYDPGCSEVISKPEIEGGKKIYIWSVIADPIYQMFTPDLNTQISLDDQLLPESDFTTKKVTNFGSEYLMHEIYLKPSETQESPNHRDYFLPLKSRQLYSGSRRRRIYRCKVRYTNQRSPDANLLASLVLLYMVLFVLIIVVATSAPQPPPVEEPPYNGRPPTYSDEPYIPSASKDNEGGATTFLLKLVFIVIVVIVSFAIYRVFRNREARGYDDPRAGQRNLDEPLRMELQDRRL